MKDSAGAKVTTDDALAWKSTTKLTLQTTAETAQVTNAKGVAVNFATLQEAIDAAQRKETVTLLAETRENVIISTSGLTLDLNGHTLNGGTEKGKPALTITNRVTVKDSSEAQTGTIMREDPQRTLV
ncbi:MAG: hypothetical protein V8S96_04995 [Lachnospiraceae bacterium]